MKICKIFSLCAVVVLVLGMIAVPVIADEVYTVEFVTNGTEYMYSLDCPAFYPGMHADVDVFCYDGFGEYFYDYTLSFDFVEFVDDGISGVAAISGTIQILQVYQDSKLLTAFYVQDMDLPEGQPFKLVFTLSGFNYTKHIMVNSFNSLIKWAGMVVSGIISGPMSGLLGVFVIGIAVCAVLLAVKVVRSFLWK